MLPLLLLIACQPDAPKVVQPNVVILTWETTRADHTSLHGYDLPTTPNLERLATRGVTFDQHVSAAPWTQPSVTSLLTGLTPSAHGVREFEDTLGDDVVTVAERMQGRGYHTAFAGVNMVFEMGRHLEQGFDWYFGQGDVDGAALGQRVDDWLRERPRDKPFFLYVHVFEPHCPYTPPAEYLGVFHREPADQTGGVYPQDYYDQMFGCFKLPAPGESGPPQLDIDAYYTAWDGEIHYADHLSALILARLQREGLLDDTLLMATADHGEAFYEHGDHGHGRQLYQEAVHVPLVVVPPWKGEGAPPWAGRRVETVTSSVDLSATALAAAEADADGIEGIDLSPAWTGGGPPSSWKQRAVYSHTDHEAYLRSVHQDGWVLIVDVREEEPDPDVPGAVLTPRHPPELYHLAEDPQQRTNLAEDPAQAERLAALLAMVGAHEAQALQKAAAWGGTRRTLDQSTEEALKALGYLEKGGP